MGREEGGGFGMGNTYMPVEDSFRCMAEPIQYCKVKKKKKSRRPLNCMTYENPSNYINPMTSTSICSSVFLLLQIETPWKTAQKREPGQFDILRT